MYVILLSFAEGRHRAEAHLEAHKAWLRKGIDDGVFLLAGTLDAGAGGAILARGESRARMEARVREDPFVSHGVVTATIHEIAPSIAAPPFRFLLG